MVVSIVPAPLRVESREGPPFVVGADIRVVVGTDPSAVSVAVLAAGDIATLVGASVVVTHHDDGSPGAIVLKLSTKRGELAMPDVIPAALAAEAYRLEVNANRVTVTALGTSGLLRGMSTLAQLMTQGVASVVVHPVVVVDNPRFAWRGLSLDLARHFFGVETVKAVISVLASLKLNVLHLHLTDDQGWRLHLPSRPALTAESGQTAVGGDEGGFFTVAEYTELVNYAAARAVTVVPEIDLPGHVNAALHAYGELTPTGEPAPAYTGVDVGFSRLQYGLPATALFVADVLGDVAAMTPGPYVHLGGDEAMTMHRAEYAEMLAVAARILVAAGKTVVGWQETARATLPVGSIVQYWDERDSVADVVGAVARGARVLLSPASRMYLDMRYDAATPMGRDWAGHIGLRDCYDWEPGDLLPVPIDRVVGVEAALWTETVSTAHEVFLMLLPRLAAVSEVAWSDPGRRRWQDFGARLRPLTARWDDLGLPWYRPALD